PLPEPYNGGRPPPTAMLPLPRAARKRKAPGAAEATVGGVRPWGFVYCTTWGAEGSRARRPGHPCPCGGTASGGVAPGRCTDRGVLADSGPETAFPATREGPDARATHHRPRRRAPS